MTDSGVVRLAALLATLVVSFIVTTEAAEWAIRAAGIKPERTSLDMTLLLRKRLAIYQVQTSKLRQRVLVLGDSTVIDAPPGKTLPQQIQNELNRLLPNRTRVWNLADPGMSVFEYRAMATDMAKLNIDLVVLGFNLSSFKAQWRANWTRRELYGWADLRDIAHAAFGPVYWWDITFDQLLLHKGLVDSGLLGAWIRERRRQSSVPPVIARSRIFLQQETREFMNNLAAGLPEAKSTTLPGESRLDRKGTEDLYLRPLSGVAAQHPMLLSLGGMVAEFRAHNIEVLVYVVPLNVDQMERVGIEDLRPIEAVSRLACEAVINHGGRCLDLHDQLHDASFKDWFGHFSTDADHDGIAWLAARLGPETVAALSRARKSRH